MFMCVPNVLHLWLILGTGPWCILILENPNIPSTLSIVYTDSGVTRGGRGVESPTAWSVWGNLEGHKGEQRERKKTGMREGKARKGMEKRERGMRRENWERGKGEKQDKGRKGKVKFKIVKFVRGNVWNWAAEGFFSLFTFENSLNLFWVYQNWNFMGKFSNYAYLWLPVWVRPCVHM